MLCCYVGHIILISHMEKETFKIEIKNGPTTLVDLAEEAILNYIKENQLKPGDEFPFDESQLSEQLSVSRNVIREALSRLNSFGIIHSRKRKGIYLQEPDMKKNLSRIIDPQLLSKERYLDLLELRYMLEIGIIPCLFENLQDKDIKELYEALPLHLIKNKDARFSTEDEIKFHTIIYKIAKNQTLIDLMQIIISMRFRLYDSSEFTIFNENLIKKNLKATHYDILKALESRDPSRYEDIIKRHLLPYHMYIKDKRG